MQDANMILETGLQLNTVAHHAIASVHHAFDAISQSVQSLAPGDDMDSDCCGCNNY